MTDLVAVHEILLIILKSVELAAATFSMIFLSFFWVLIVRVPESYLIVELHHNPMDLADLICLHLLSNHP